MSALQNPSRWILVVTPSKAAAAELLVDMRRSSEICGIQVNYDKRDDFASFRLPTRGIRIATANQLFQFLSKGVPDLRDLCLVICEGLEQLSPPYELSLSLLLFATQGNGTRFVGVSASLADPDPLARWLRVEQETFTKFRPKDRDQSLFTHKHTLSMPYSAALFKWMARPAHRAISQAAPSASVLVFVPSRGQCRAIAQDLITQCTLEAETARGYTPDDVLDDALEAHYHQLYDPSLADTLGKGVGFFHPGIHRQDQAMMLSMFAEGIIRVLVAPKDTCWEIPVRANVVIVMGTQFTQPTQQGMARQVQDYSLAELARMQSRAVQQTEDGHFHIFCPAESLETYSKFLDEGLPLESQLLDSNTLRMWARRFQKEKFDRQGMMNALSFTYLAQRIMHNPSYYGFTSQSQRENLSSIVDKVAEDLKGTN